MGSYRQSNNLHSQENNDHNSCGCHRSNRNRNCGCNNNVDEVIVNPTRIVENTRTRNKVVKHIHPTEVVNVNRTIVRNEHFFPVREREVNEKVEENFNCGTDPRRRGNCRPFGGRF